MAVQSVADALIGEIRGRLQFVANLTAGGMDRDSLMETQAQTISVSIANASGLTMEVATLVSGEINGGPWSIAQKAALCTVLGDRIANAGSRPQKRARDQQSCKALHLYLTNSDWAA
eukprot:7698365-Pyramimonas_sp.AAC.1